MNLTSNRVHCGAQRSNPSYPAPVVTTTLKTAITSGLPPYRGQVPYAAMDLPAVPEALLEKKAEFWQVVQRTLNPETVSSPTKMAATGEVEARVSLPVTQTTLTENSTRAFPRQPCIPRPTASTSTKQVK